MTEPDALDEIDRAVDRAILDRARAAKIKQALHQQFDLTRPERRDTAAEADEAEEFWDNVPL